jgi:lysine 2,3-aminomutase
MIYNNVQKEIANRIEGEEKLSNWRDWKWQLKHAIKSIDKFEQLTGITFEKKEKEILKRHLINSRYQLHPIIYR